MNGKRSVIRISHLNGGIQDKIELIFDYDVTISSTQQYIMKEDTYEEDLGNIAMKLDPNSTGLSTSANMRIMELILKVKIKPL